MHFSVFRRWNTVYFYLMYKSMCEYELKCSFFASFHFDSSIENDILCILYGLLSSSLHTYSLLNCTISISYRLIYLLILTIHVETMQFFQRVNKNGWRIKSKVIIMANVWMREKRSENGNYHKHTAHSQANKTWGFYSATQNI